MAETLFVLLGRSVTLGEAVLAGSILAFLLLIGILIWRGRRARHGLEAEAAARHAELEGQIGALLSAQSEMTGRMQAMAEMLGSRQADLSKAVSERLEGMSHRLNQSVGEAAKNTHENLKG